MVIVLPVFSLLFSLLLFLPNYLVAAQTVIHGGKFTAQLYDYGAARDREVWLTNGSAWWAEQPASQESMLVLVSQNPAVGAQFNFTVRTKENYTVFSLKSMAVAPGFGAMSVTLKTARTGLVVFPLNYMTTRASETEVSVNYLLWDRKGKFAVEPLGKFAMFFAIDDAAFDEVLLQLWADEGLPHAQVQGPWSRERAREWLSDWQTEFQEQVYLTANPSTNAELLRLAEYAARGGVTSLDFFGSVWQGTKRYTTTWVNRALFPKGEEDFSAFSETVRNLSMALSLYTFSVKVDELDPLANPPHANLSGWISGVTATQLSTSTRLSLKPDPGSPPVLPQPVNLLGDFKYPWQRRTLMEIDRLAFVGHQIVGVQSWAPNATSGLWEVVLSSAVSFPANTTVKGLYRPRGAFSPDSTSSLLGQHNSQYADFCNRHNVRSINCDGNVIHYDYPWGWDKFGWSMMERLDHATASISSTGSYLPFHMEYEFRSSRRMRFCRVLYHLGTHTVMKPSPSPYEFLFTFTSMLSYQSRFFCFVGNGAYWLGVSESTLSNYGLSDALFFETLPLMRKVMSAGLQANQLQQLGTWFTTYRGVDSTPYGATDVLARPVESPDGLSLVPVRMLGRVAGEMNWCHGQEFGVLVPKQYAQAGGPGVTVRNPWAAQEPEFVIRVLAAFNLTDRSRSLMPLTPLPGATTTNCQIEQLGGVLRLSKTTAGTAFQVPRTVETTEGALHKWALSTSMDNARGMGLTVVGDASGAILLIVLSGREFVVKVDFNGSREFVIPSDMAAWSDPVWGWRFPNKMNRYTVSQVMIGLGHVPARTTTVIDVSNLRLLPEISVGLVDPTIHLGESGSMTIEGTVATDKYIWFSGKESSVGIYSLDWNLERKFSVTRTNFIAEGDVAIYVTSGNALVGLPEPYLEWQFFVADKSMRIQNYTSPPSTNTPGSQPSTTAPGRQPQENAPTETDAPPTARATALSAGGVAGIVVATMLVFVGAIVGVVLYARGSRCNLWEPYARVERKNQNFRL